MSNEEKPHLPTPNAQSGGALAERPPSSIAVPQSGVYYRPPDEDEINLLDLWWILVRRKWTVMIFFLIVTTAGITASFLMTPIYRAEATLLIDREPPKVVEYQDIAPVESASSREDFYQTQYGLLKSRSLAKRVFEELDLARHPVFAANQSPSLWGRLKASLKNLWTAQSPKAAEGNDGNLNLKMDGLINRFQQGITVEPVKNSRLVKVYYDSPDPKLSAQVVKTLAQAFINANLERRYDATAYARDFLKDRLLQIKARLEETEQKLVEYANDHEIINFDESQSLVAQKLKEMSASLSAAQEERAKAEAFYQQMQRTAGGGLPQVLESPMIQQLKASLAQLEGKYGENLHVYKPDYPKMKQLREQITKLQGKIDEEVNNVRAAIQSNYEAAVTLENLLAGKVKTAKEEIKDLAQRSIEYQVLKRETDTNRQLYEGLLQRYKEVGVAGGVGLNNISVVDPAKIPLESHKPNIKLNALLAMVLGLFGGIGLAFLFEHLDDTLKQSEEMEQLLGLSALGLIPLVPNQNKALPAGESLALVSVEDKRSSFAEAYRSVRTALQFSTPEGAPKSLLVTSAGKGEGKSTTAVSLAIHFAQAGQKVLLVDSDLRNPSLHRVLEMDNGVGLTNYLAGEATPVEISQPTTISNLFLITTGPLPPDPAGLLGSAKMMSLLSMAKEKFDHVILDSPPVLGLADALVLGNLVDGTLFVVSAGDTRRAFAQGAIKRLRTGQTRILGGVLTKFDSRSHGYGYGYGYHDYYYYPQEDSQTALPPSDQKVA
ncbi:GumC family protein [Nitrosococcus wardiae]|uniref:Polysaccharide biosynthesis tyrosine autokinase n=1 Tax=Nitrosococcus wardiae TaxID=1814290 RepID=A0A4P7C0M1_9GAMM|nr:polysaccharide biosynthesis tyrosine autokinase [Nitrosococcus wardiae]QBQ55981.1 polysaccharide biosynthesis tyrosine autokinase [Nitrosococcus wardiae]